MKKCNNCLNFARNEFIDRYGYCPECLIKICIKELKNEISRRINNVTE